MRNIQMKNKDLVLIYKYLKGRITRYQLADDLGRTRTNTYYYIGRAAAYWLRKGILRFRTVKDDKDLGGWDV